MGKPVFCASLSVTAAGGAGSLDLDGEGSAGTHIVKVADVSASTGVAQGFTLTITSGNLTKAGAVDVIAYQVTLVGDGAQAPDGSAFTVSSGTNYTFSTSSAGSVDKDLYIKYTPASLLDPGTYSASCTLSVMDN